MGVEAEGEGRVMGRLDVSSGPSRRVPVPKITMEGQKVCDRGGDMSG